MRLKIEDVYSCVQRLIWSQSPSGDLNLQFFHFFFIFAQSRFILWSSSSVGLVVLNLLLDKKHCWEDNLHSSYSSSGSKCLTKCFRNGVRDPNSRRKSPRSRSTIDSHYRNTVYQQLTGKQQAIRMKICDAPAEPQCMWPTTMRFTDKFYGILFHFTLFFGKGIGNVLNSCRWSKFLRIP